MAALINLFRRFRKARFPFKFVYSNRYWMVDLGDHIFPVTKYRLIYENLLCMGVKKENFLSPQPAKNEDLLLVHTSKYLKKIKAGSLSNTDILILELPFSSELLSFSLLSVGGTILTAEQGLMDGMAVHIGGGFHHAFPDHGEGFCVLNDVAVAIEKMIHEKKIRKAMIVDCDLHQGNGNAHVFAKKDCVFTFSIHQMDIYPARKPSSSLDIGLWAGDGDEKYLTELRSHFPRLYEEFQPDLVFYLAGADPYEKDQLGGLRLTMEGLRERDRIITEEARKLRIPVAVLLAGGYAYDVNDTVSIHLNTINVVQKAQRKFA